MQENRAQHWDEKFKTRAWGRYPPEDFVRFIGRNYFPSKERSQIRILEVGCGPGANLWFLHREGFRVYGIDGSPTAIEIASKRLEEENKGLNVHPPELRVGNFQKLPWADRSFDVVVDIFAIYSNPLQVIRVALEEIHRVLKPGGKFYSKVWGKESTGYGLGKKVEEDTFDEIPSGPFKNMGLTHFFDRKSIESIYSLFYAESIERLTRTDQGTFTEEYLCQFIKKV